MRKRQRSFSDLADEQCSQASPVPDASVIPLPYKPADTSCGPRKRTRGLLSTVDPAGSQHLPSAASSSRNSRPVASRPRSVTYGAGATTDSTDSSDDEVDEGSSSKGKSRENGTRRAEPSDGRPFDLNSLDLDQLEAFVVAAKADKVAKGHQHDCGSGGGRPGHSQAVGVDEPGVQGQPQPSTKGSRMTLDRQAEVAEPSKVQKVQNTLAAPPTQIDHGKEAMNPPQPDVSLEKMEASAVAQVMEIVPNANVDHVLVMVCAFLPVYGQGEIVNFVVQQLMEAPFVDQGGREHEGPDETPDIKQGARAGSASPSGGRGQEERILEEELLGTGLDEVDCACCFNQYSLEDMARCTKGHVCCAGCLRRHAEHQFGTGNPALSCVDISGCNAAFTDSELRRFLPVKLFGLYERLVQQQELKNANIQGLEDCPFCEWACIFETPKGLHPEMVCGNQDACGASSCRLCRRRWHEGKTCVEVEREEKDALALEEVMTLALKRNCPRCQKAFIKLEGCNKMTCPDKDCLAQSCYICKKEIEGYGHFRANPDDPLYVPCPLWDKVDVNHQHEMDIEEAVAQYKRGSVD